MGVVTEQFGKNFRVASRLEKRRQADIDAGVTEPYEVVEQLSWHNPDGTEIDDPTRFEELESNYQSEKLTNGDNDSG